MTPQELLNNAGIQLKGYEEGRVYATCPQCSSGRKRHHQKLRCLSIKIEPDKAYWRCHHCGWTGPQKGSGGNGKEAWPHYDYGDDLRKLRTPYEQPPYIWQHRNGKGEWESTAGDADTSVLLYRIDQVREAVADDGGVVLVVEGEKDANTCWDLGFAATCNSSGASKPGYAPKWRIEHSEQLRGMDVVVCGDNDEPGRDHVRAVCECSQNVARSVRVIDLATEWDELPDGGDVSDWAAWAGPGAEARLIDLVNEAKPYAPDKTEPKSRPHALPFHLPIDIMPVRKPWLIKGVFAREEVSSFIGKPGGGKSALLTDAGVYLSCCEAWRDHKISKNFGVVYFALERGVLTRRRVTAYRQRGDLPQNFPFAVVSNVIDLLNPSCVAIVLDTVMGVEDRTGVEVAMIVFDTYSKGIAAGGGDEDKARDQNRVAANLRRIIEQKPLHIAGVGHTGKDESRGERGSNARLADVDLQVTINGEDKIRTATVTKANDQDEGPLTTFAMERIHTGVDEDGLEEQTYIVDPQSGLTPVSGISVRGKKPTQANLMLKILAQAIDEIGQTTTTISGRVPKGSRTILIPQLLSGYSRALVADSDKPDTISKAIRRSLKDLQARGLIGVWGDHVWLTDKAGQ